MFEEIAEALSRGDALALLTVVRTHGSPPCRPGTKVLVRADGSLVGSLGGATTDARARTDALDALATGTTTLLTYRVDAATGESVGSCGATLEVFVEPLCPEPRLLVAGSGAVAQGLARLLTPLGWRVALLDDRYEFLQGAALPPNVELAVGQVPDLLRDRQPNALTAIVIATRDHDADSDCLRAACETPAGYIGMMSSPGKARTIFRALLRAGLPPAALERVCAPIGLDLGAQTPDEIALSIAAELLLWRRGGSGQPLHNAHDILAGLLAQREAAAAPHEALG